jgi:hypothetical protein
VFTHGPTIKVSRPEYDALQEERRAANRQIPNLITRRALTSGVAATVYAGRLEVIGRDRDGSLLARIRYPALPERESYVRKVRVAGAIGSTLPRGIHLRRVAKSG